VWSTITRLKMWECDCPHSNFSWSSCSVGKANITHFLVELKVCGRYMYSFHVHKYSHLSDYIHRAYSPSPTPLLISFSDISSSVHHILAPSGPDLLQDSYVRFKPPRLQVVHVLSCVLFDFPTSSLQTPQRLLPQVPSLCPTLSS